MVLAYPNEVSNMIENNAAIRDNLISTSSNFLASELHFFVGMGGIKVSCCDEKKSRRTFKFNKICIGGAIGGSISTGVISGLSGKKCRSNFYAGWFYELGGSVGPVGGGVDYGYNSDGSLSGVNEGGVGGGFGAYVKSTWCYYVYVEGSETVEKCGCAQKSE